MTGPHSETGKDPRSACPPSPIVPGEHPLGDNHLHDIDGSLHDSNDPNRLSRNNQIGLGTSVLECHGVSPSDRPIVVMHSFVAEPQGDARTPFAVVPDPVGDVYLNFLAVPASHPEEHVLCLPLQPGMEDYYREIGLLAPSTKLIEVSPKLGEEAALGFPYSHPLVLLKEQGRKLPDGAHLVATFPGELTRQLSAELGATVAQHSDPSLTNNKAYFRDMAARDGFRVLPGLVVSNEEDLERAYSMFQGAGRVWLKLGHGSGGDVVRPIDAPFSKENFVCALRKMHTAVERAFTQNHYGPGALEAFWPNNELLPRGSSLSLERDANDFGEVIVNGSNVMLLSHDGTISIPSYFRQRTGPNGEYLGSEIWNPHSELRGQLDEQAAKVSVHLLNDLKFRGLIGIDFFVIRNSGIETAYLTEVNGRPPISSTAMLIADKVARNLGEPTFHWVNVNLWRKEGPLNTFQDFQQSVTIEGRDYTHGTIEEGLVIPQAMRAMHGISQDGISHNGDRQLLIASNAAKTLVIGRNAEHCEEILTRLRAHGISDSPHNFVD